jgi:hypothetical protein
MVITKIKMDRNKGVKKFFMLFAAYFFEFPARFFSLQLLNKVSCIRLTPFHSFKEAILCPN